MDTSKKNPNFPDRTKTVEQVIAENEQREKRAQSLVKEMKFLLRVREVEE